MFYPEDFANFALEKSFVPNVPFFCDVYEYGKLGISVNTSPIMALVLQFSGFLLEMVYHTYIFL